MVWPLDMLWVTFLAAGVVFGLAGGLAPGPMTALVIGQTLRFGPREGVKVAFAPLFTDGPLLVVSALAAERLGSTETALGAVSLVGAGFLVWLAWDSVRAAGLPVDAGEASAATLRKAVVTNLLNPHPYLFWFTVGGPMLVESGRGAGVLGVAALVGGFFGSLVGAKVGIALALGRYRAAFVGAPYRWTMRLLGLAMLGFAATFVRDGGGQLGWW